MSCRGLNAPDQRLGRGSRSRARNPGAIRPVLQRERSAMPFGDLPGEDKADARAAGLGGEERNEQVRGRAEAGTFILHAFTPSKAPFC